MTTQRQHAFDQPQPTTPAQMCAALVWLRITQQFPSLKGRLAVKFQRQGRLIYEAREYGPGVMLHFAVQPSDPGFEDAVRRAARAAHQIVFTSTHATRVRTIHA